MRLGDKNDILDFPYHDGSDENKLVQWEVVIIYEPRQI